MSALRRLARFLSTNATVPTPPAVTEVVLVGDVAITDVDLEWAVAMRRSRSMTCAEIARHLGGLTAQQVSTVTKGRI